MTRSKQKHLWMAATRRIFRRHGRAENTDKLLPIESLVIKCSCEES